VVERVELDFGRANMVHDRLAEHLLPLAVVSSIAERVTGLKLRPSSFVDALDNRGDGTRESVGKKPCGPPFAALQAGAP
jgi:hypothetical protein